MILGRLRDSTAVFSIMGKRHHHLTWKSVLLSDSQIWSISTTMMPGQKIGAVDRQLVVIESITLIAGKPMTWRMR